jgi:lipoate-protein ligase B
MIINNTGHAHVWKIVDLKTLPYMIALNLQHRMVEARRIGTLKENTVLLLEHPPVYTLGHNGGLENLKVSKEFLEQKGVQIVKTRRGGNITYHGPGQIIAYPIIDLNTDKIGVLDYVADLEELMIRTAWDCGVKAQRNSLNRGVWVGNKKVGSVGIAIRHGITYHGLALNVNLSLKYFSWINPCGLNNISMTSLKQEGMGNVDVKEIKDGIVRHMEDVFGIKPMRWKPDDFLRQFPLNTET